MSIKSNIFFLVLFGLIIFGYFYYETFLQYFPINRCIQIFIVVIGISAFFFPSVIQKLRDGEDMDNIKKHIIEKYQKK